MRNLDRPDRPKKCTLLAVTVLAVALLASGCADTTYLWGSATGHLKLLQAARPVDDWLADDSTPLMLKQRLLQAQGIRHFAIDVLKLPDNASYQRYAQLQRRAVVWNVVAAPPYSLTLKTWCFPVVGCVGYRGYFEEQDAQQEADAQRAQGLEASVYGVPAYSTLGWTNWLGGDPLLSTFIQYPQGELARMVFHEMSHQVVYVQGDTAFNESFATAGCAVLGVTRRDGALMCRRLANRLLRGQTALQKRVPSRHTPPVRRKLHCWRWRPTGHRAPALPNFFLAPRTLGETQRKRPPCELLAPPHLTEYR